MLHSMSLPDNRSNISSHCKPSQLDASWAVSMLLTVLHEDIANHTNKGYACDLPDCFKPEKIHPQRRLNNNQVQRPFC
jgi:hypothetical protein